MIFTIVNSFHRFDVVQFVVARFGHTEKNLVKLVKPFVIGMVVILFIVEAVTVAAIELMDSMKSYDKFINLYRAVLGVDVLMLATFFSIYGIRIMTYLKQTTIKDVGKKTLRV